MYNSVDIGEFNICLNFVSMMMIYFIYRNLKPFLMHDTIFRKISDISECIFSNITLTYKIGEYNWVPHAYS